MFDRYRFVFFFKQKTAYEIRPRDWSSDVCSSDLERERERERERKRKRETNTTTNLAINS